MNPARAHSPCFPVDTAFRETLPSAIPSAPEEPTYSTCQIHGQLTAPTLRMANYLLGVWHKGNVTVSPSSLSLLPQEKQ